MERSQDARLGTWEALHLMAAAQVALIFWLGIYATALSTPRPVLYSGGVEYFSDLGTTVLNWGFAVSEGVLCLGGALLMVRPGGTADLPKAFPLRGRWLVPLLRAFAWVGPGVAGTGALAFTGYPVDFTTLMFLTLAGVVAYLFLLAPVYLILAVRAILVATDEDGRADQLGESAR